MSSATDSEMDDAGMISEQLVKSVKSVVGVDISQKSVDRYNAQAASLGLSPGQMKAECVELKGEPGELDGATFDLVVVRASLTANVCCVSLVRMQCCASYHHFASIEDTTRLLASFLKPGGSLLVADIRAEEDNRELFPESHHGLVPHTHGISETRLRTVFEGAGLQDFEMKDVVRENMRHLEQEMTWFVARGVKAVQ